MRHDSLPTTWTNIARGAVLSAALLSTQCGGTTAQPSGSALVTLQVANETFRLALTGADGVDAARRAQAGGAARIPNGRIVAGTGVNTGWSWHLEDVAFAEVAIELCDGRPSDVERQGPAFGGGRYCPWLASVIQIEEVK